MFGQKHQQTTIFLPKINKVLLSSILQNLNERSVLDNSFENDCLDELKKMLSRKKNQADREDGQNCKILIKI